MATGNLLQDMVSLESEVFETQKAHIDAEKRYLSIQAEYRQAKYAHQSALQKKEMLCHRIEELLQEDAVYLHLHCTIEGCSNVFVRCPRTEAQQFLAYWPVLCQCVEVCTLNGGDPEFSLGNVTIELLYGVIGNQHHEMCCDLCAIDQEIKLASDHKFPLLSRGNLFYYKKTDLFEAVMLYSIVDLLKQLSQQHVKTIFADVETKKVRQLNLSIDNVLTCSVDIPESRYEIINTWNGSFTWLEPIELGDVKLITAVNGLVKMYELAKQNPNSDKQLVIA